MRRRPPPSRARACACKIRRKERFAFRFGLVVSPVRFRSPIRTSALSKRSARRDEQTRRSRSSTRRSPRDARLTPLFFFFKIQRNSKSRLFGRGCALRLFVFLGAPPIQPGGLTLGRFQNVRFGRSTVISRATGHTHELVRARVGPRLGETRIDHSQTPWGEFPTDADLATCLGRAPCAASLCPAPACFCACVERLSLELFFRLSRENRQSVENERSLWNPKKIFSQRPAELLLTAVE